MQHTKPILTLIVLAMVMPELVTGSTTLPSFLIPINFIINFLGYGIAILLIRELYVRYKLNFLGLFLLGVAYAGLNEGIIAKTFLLESGIPWNIFDNYGYILGISVPWALAMSIWHSVFSVMFPILATHFLFVGVSRDSWLNKKTIALLLVPLTFVSLAAFFGPFRGQGTVEQLLLILSGMTVLTLLSVWFCRKKEEGEPQYPITTKPVWLGVSTVLSWTILLCIVMVGLKVPLLLFFAVFASIVAFYMYIFRKKIGITNDTLLLFILGGYFQTAITGLLLSFFFVPATFGERLPAEIIVLTVSVILLRKVFKRHKTGIV